MRSIAFFCLSAALVLAQPPRKAPSFTLPDLQQNFHDLTDHRGKVVIVEMMLTSCPHCSDFSKVLEQIHRQYAGRVQVFSIVNPPDTIDTVKAYIAAAKTTFPVLFDCGQASYAFTRTPSVALPRVWIIDRQGMIRHDVAYNDQTKPFFEKRGIFTELDKVLNAPAPVPAKK